ncbi:acid-sensing ion channel 4-A-like [Parasteatoda tepidariorum]|uniref:acid-sensing ion channel 4-A-like n=1 Tax=Parasteatoda tepidariorum TaxID=114398 RepID=UPI00077FE3EB|nr:acid-sensing ion channel 4-A-like [Parasteatoda tepidariorum]
MNQACIITDHKYGRKIKTEQQVLSNVYALSRILDTKNRCIKIMWIYITAIAIVASMFQFVCFTKKFLSYPTVTSLLHKIDDKDQYPSVTICNLNRIKRTSDNCLKLALPWAVCYGNRVFFNGSYLILSERKNFFSCKRKQKNTNSEEKNTIMGLLTKFAKLGLSERKSLGSKAETFITHCTFRGQQCNWKDFTLTHSLQYGNCFTFNSSKYFYGNEINKSYGYNKGLEIILNLETVNYLPLLSASVGAKVIIHDSFEEPNIEDKGFFISPGFQTSVSLRKTVVERLPSPFKDQCKNYKSEFTTQSDCIRRCIQKESYQECGCIDPGIETKSTGFRICNLTNSFQMCCLDNVIENMAIHGPICPCPLPCLSTKYEEVVTRTKWPSQKYFYEYQIHQLNLTDFQTHIETFKWFHTFLDIYSDTYEMDLIKQESMFESSELYSCLGGNLGLFLGISFAVVFEIVEFVIVMLINFVRQF